MSKMWVKERVDSEFLLSVFVYQKIPRCDYKAKRTNQMLIAMSVDNLLQGAYSLIRVQHSALQKSWSGGMRSLGVLKTCQ